MDATGVRIFSAPPRPLSICTHQAGNRAATKSGMPIEAGMPVEGPAEGRCDAKFTTIFQFPHFFCAWTDCSASFCRQTGDADPGRCSEYAAALPWQALATSRSGPGRASRQQAMAKCRRLISELRPRRTQQHVNLDEAWARSGVIRRDSHQRASPHAKRVLPTRPKRDSHRECRGADECRRVPARRVWRDGTTITKRSG